MGQTIYLGFARRFLFVIPFAYLSRGKGVLGEKEEDSNKMDDECGSKNFCGGS